MNAFIAPLKIVSSIKVFLNTFVRKYTMPRRRMPTAMITICVTRKEYDRVEVEMN